MYIELGYYSVLNPDHCFGNDMRNPVKSLIILISTGVISSEGGRDLFLDLLLWLDSDEPPSLLLLESRPSIVRNEFGKTLLSSSSILWSIRVSASQLSIKLSETVNTRGPSLDEFPAEPEVVASVVDCGGVSVATVGRLTAEISVATVGRLTAGISVATVGMLISATSLVATVGRLTTKRVSAATVCRLTTGRRDATVGRLISTTSLAATEGRLTTKFDREDDAPPVPSAA